VLPYFLKSEDNTEIGRVRAQDHATGGPMTVQRCKHDVFLNYTALILTLFSLLSRLFMLVKIKTIWNRSFFSE